ncbi:hypothetical protein Amsp01_061010 [Amycolatopsis sp. NBRC 101858]|nr:hypothetical protein Amsp01_061010 [Amycolatopsis sp. NBRC 101858]
MTFAGDAGGVNAGVDGFGVVTAVVTGRVVVGVFEVAGSGGARGVQAVQVSARTAASAAPDLPISPI